MSAASEERWRERMLRWRVGVFARGYEDPEFSAAQRDFYEALHELGAERFFTPSELWNTPKGFLAKLIVLDQFPRCVYRGTPLAYENDAICAPMLREIFARGWDLTEYNVMERLWAYIALSHPEDRELQELSVEKWTAWSAALIAAAAPQNRRVNQRVGWNFVKAVIEHGEAVLLHGKFPHRNPIMNRPHRAGEIHYLTSELRPPWSFTQPPRPEYYALHAALHGIERWADCRGIDRNLLRAWHHVLGLEVEPAGASFMDVFSVLGREQVTFQELYRHVSLRRNEATLARALASPGLAPHLQRITQAIFRDASAGWPPKRGRASVPKVIDVPALNLAIGCPLLDRGDVCVPRTALDNFVNKTGFVSCSFDELFARHQEVVAQAITSYELSSKGVRRSAPIERRAFEQLAGRLFEPSPARDGVLTTLYELLDLDYDGTVDAGEVLVALLAFSTGSLDDKLRTCFQVFDADGNGKLDHDELTDLVHTTLLRGLHVVEALFRNYLPEGSRESTDLVVLFSLKSWSAIEHAAGTALVEADGDHDGMVDESEFCAWGAKHPLLSQLLGLSRTLVGS